VSEYADVDDVLGDSGANGTRRRRDERRETSERRERLTSGTREGRLSRRGCVECVHGGRRGRTTGGVDVAGVGI